VPSSKVRVGAVEIDHSFSGLVFNSTSPSRAATITAAGGNFSEYCNMGNVTIVIDGRIEALRLGGREHFGRVPSTKVLALAS